jgi:hypothetical protein
MEKKVNLKSLANIAIKEEEYSLSGAIKRFKRQLQKDEVQNYIVSVGLTTELVCALVVPATVVECFPNKKDDNGNIVALKKVKGQYVVKEKFSIWDILNCVSKIGKEYSKK